MSTLETDERRAITLHEMDRLMFFRRHPNLATLVREVSLSADSELTAPPWSIPMTAHDVMQLVYAIFPRLQEVVSLCDGPSIAPPRLTLPCCQTLHTIRSFDFDASTWTSLQACTGLRHLGIEEMELYGPLPVVPPSLPFRLVTLVIDMIRDNDIVDVFLMPFLRACGPTLERLSLGVDFDYVRDLSTLPKLATLSVTMTSDYTFERVGETLDEWLATILPTCHALEHLRISAFYVGDELHRTPAGLLAVPEVAAALPSTLKRIDFDMPPRKGQLEAALSKNNSVQVIGMPTLVRPNSRSMGTRFGLTSQTLPLLCAGGQFSVA